MNRQINEALVHQAMHNLDNEGKKPTVTNVRDAIGFGSYTTIGKHMATYDPEEMDGPSETPEAPLPAIEAIWQIAYRKAWIAIQDQLSSTQTLLDAERAQTTALAKALDDAERLSEQQNADIRKLEGYIKTTSNEKTEIREAFENERRTSAELRGELKALKDHAAPTPTPRKKAPPKTPSPAKNP